MAARRSVTERSTAGDALCASLGARSRAGVVIGVLDSSFLGGEAPMRRASSSITEIFSVKPSSEEPAKNPPGLLRFESALDRILSGLVLVIPTALLAGLGFLLLRALGVPRLRQSSKQSSQQGRPRTSTMGRVPISRLQPSHLKHLVCHTLPKFSMKPPSVLSLSTSFPQAAQKPLEPPCAVKQSRQ